MERKYVLVINPGSTSTKVAIYDGDVEIKTHKIQHKEDELAKYDSILDQYEYRLNLILNWLDKENIKLCSLKAVVGRGGLLRPIPGGTYLVTDKMIEDLRLGVGGEHAANLGGILARGIADRENISSYIVDPVSVDEFEEVARISGLNLIERKSLIHALNIKAVSHRRAEELNKNLEELNLIVAHLGGGISVAPVRRGRMIDVNNASEMGPFSPERTGSLPVGDLVKMCYSGNYTYEDMKKKIKGKGGLVSYLDTIDAREVEKRIESGDEYAKLIFDAMIYQIGKEIGAASAVLKGEVDNIILTGGLACSKYLVERLTEMVSFIGPVIVYPGEDEMGALNKGVLRVINGEEKPKIYENEVIR
ncbi:butyrate kinase [Tepidimicrobium xylanilyticum]|uniref:butyrate kinase n=1 Tax=Tepidimicrobium xylanilyticum TaxID=1123352 RepID=UPI002650E855|nr:butyrate kinase [Tepidimicrobium xylanilyticum]GMG96663.1 putative butyrate kinase [Tepidimicrobium xylanilyticum]